jgi:hypothetical protein
LCLAALRFRLSSFGGMRVSFVAKTLREKITA